MGPSGNGDGCVQKVIPPDSNLYTLPPRAISTQQFWELWNSLNIWSAVPSNNFLLGFNNDTLDKRLLWVGNPTFVAQKDSPQANMISLWSILGKSVPLSFSLIGIFKPTNCRFVRQLILRSFCFDLHFPRIGIWTSLGREWMDMGLPGGKSRIEQHLYYVHTTMDRCQ